MSSEKNVISSTDNDKLFGLVQRIQITLRFFFTSCLVPHTHATLPIFQYHTITLDFSSRKSSSCFAAFINLQHGKLATSSSVNYPFPHLSCSLVPTLVTASGKHPSTFLDLCLLLNIFSSSLCCSQKHL